MNTDTIDVETKVEAPPMALTTVDAVKALDKVPDKPQQLAKTAQEMRVVEVSEALLPAYQKMGTLEMTDKEIEALTAPFPDEVVETRPHDGLIYIPHIHVSDRLNRIFKPGKWALVRRREWYDEGASTMYGEYVLIIRGCYVGESVGGHPYIKKNPKTNYSDVLESTAAEALRRIAGKRLSCGSQVWDPDYCRRWETKWRGCSNGKYFKRSSDAPQQPQTPRTPTVAQKPPTEAPSAPNGSPGITSYPTVEVVTVREKKGVSASTNKPWTVWFIKFSDGFCELEAGTFDSKVADLANDLANTQEQGSLEVKPGRKANTLEIVSLVRASATQVPSDEPPFNPNEEPSEVTP